MDTKASQCPTLQSGEYFITTYQNFFKATAHRGTTYQGKPYHCIRKSVSLQSSIEICLCWRRLLAISNPSQINTTWNDWITCLLLHENTWQNDTKYNGYATSTDSYYQWTPPKNSSEREKKVHQQYLAII